MALLHNVPVHHPLLDGALADAWATHRAVMQLFGDLPTGDDPSTARQVAGVLFRVEPDVVAHDGSRGRVLVQSTTTPTADGLRTTDLSDHLASFVVGDEVRVLVRANTARTINCTCARDGSPRPEQPRPGVEWHTHRTRVADADLPGWLADRLAGAVTLDTTTVVTDLTGATTTLPAVKSIRTETRLRSGATSTQLIGNDLHAFGRVDDAEALRAHCLGGIGRAKPYGYGMLTVVHA